MTVMFPNHIDNSMRKELVKCETAAKYKYELGLRAAGDTKVDLHAGKAFASGMEAMRRAFYIDKQSANESLKIGVDTVLREYGSFVAPDKSNKTAARMAGALAFYEQQCPLDEEKLRPIRLDDQTYGIEVGFSFPIDIEHPESGRELEYCGRFDMLALDEREDVWVVDEKTTSQMGDKWANQWLLDSQVTGYCWGAQKLLEEQYGLQYEVKGAVINGIAIRLRDYEHMRLNQYRQQWEIDRWFHQMKSDVIRWKDAYVNGLHNQILDHACALYNNPCEFAPLCKSRNPERVIESGSYQVVRWNPLTRTESNA